MKKVGKEQREQEVSLTRQLATAKAKAADIVARYNEVFDDLVNISEELKDHLIESNKGVIKELEELRLKVYGEIEDYIDERSDKWQESEKAEDYRNWQEKWENEIGALEMPENHKELDADEIFDEAENSVSEWQSEVEV